MTPRQDPNRKLRGSEVFAVFLALPIMLGSFMAHDAGRLLPVFQATADSKWGAVLLGTILVAPIWLAENIGRKFGGAIWAYLGPLLVAPVVTWVCWTYLLT